MNVSVILCSYTEDRWTDLNAAVDSILAQTCPPEEIIVVIDHNPALLQRVYARLPGLIAVENQQERGLSGARNTGISISQGQILAFLDDDARAAPDCLERLVSHFRDPSIIGVGGRVEPLWDGKVSGWLPEEYYWVIGCNYKGFPEQLSTVRNLFGGCMCLRREICTALGGFRIGVGRSTGLPMGCEETEFCIRAHQHRPDSRCVYEPLARAYHRVPIYRARWSYFRSRCYAEGFSKAQISGLVGWKDGLASERRYVLFTLPKGIGRGLNDALHGDFIGLARAGSILAGLLFTGVGFLIGSVKTRKRITSPAQSTSRDDQPMEAKWTS